MPVMFCYIDPFIMRQQVVKLTPGDTEVIFEGGLDEVCRFIANEYNNGGYDRVALKGTLAETVADRVRETSKLMYGLKEIEIEVLK